MWVCRGKIQSILAVVLGVLLVAGCSGHSVKYGANSKGEDEIQQSNEKKVSPYRNMDDSDEYVDTTIPGGWVDGTNPYGLSNKMEPTGTSIQPKNKMGKVELDDRRSSTAGKAKYGHDYPGVSGSDPNHGPVTGFSQEVAPATNPDPEAWAKKYLGGGTNSQGLYEDPSQTSSSLDKASHSLDKTNPSVDWLDENARYGHDYAGVPHSGPTYGPVDGFSQGEASASNIDPVTWAETYAREHGGPSPEYIASDLNIAQSEGEQDGEVYKNGMGLEANLNSAEDGSEGRVQDIYFAFDSWSITPEGARYLEEGARWLQRHPRQGVTIEGHCDQRGTQDYNLVLGKKRAEAAREYLVSLGIQPNRIKIVSYGKERPFCQKEDERCFQENRRSHMVVKQMM